MYRKLYLAGLGVYAVLLVLAVVFYMERTAFLDMAFALCNMAKDGDFAIQISRFGDALARILPFLAIKAGLSLKVVAMSYSLGFVLVYLACYVLCGSVFKQYWLALVALLINVLFAAHSFYWPLTQVSQAMALSMVVLAAIWNRQLKTISIPRAAISVALLITIGFFHPLTIIVFAFIGGFLLLSSHETDKRLIYAAAAVFMVAFLTKMLLFKTNYEHSSFGSLKHFIKLFPNYFNIHSNRAFLKNCLTLYYFIPLTGCMVLAAYLRSGQRLKALFFLAFTLGYLALINISYPYAGTPPFYIEVLYLPLALFIALPLVFDVLPALQPRYAVTLMVLIMLTGCVRIYATHSSYTARLQWERDFLNKHGHHKIIADSHKADAAVLQMLWGTPYEFWLLSTIETGQSASIIIDEKPHEREWAQDHKQSFIVNWDIYEYNELPHNAYFRFTDTTTGYLIDPELK